MLRMMRSLSFICLLMAITTMAQGPPVLGADGQPLRSGVAYTIEPGITDVTGGLNLVARNGSCPNYVGLVPIALPIVFQSRNPRDTNITETTEVAVSFIASLTCVQGPTFTWSIGEEDEETRRRLIVTGGLPDFFTISSNQPPGPYTFGYCPPCTSQEPPCPTPRCSVAGTLEQNGSRFLALDGPAFSFRFRRA